MATLKQKAQRALGLEKKKARIEPKHIVTGLIGGALLFYAYKRQDKTLGRIAGLAGSSLLGRGLSGVAGVI